MKAFDIKRVLLVALVATLPVACGSSLPMGADVPNGDGAVVSALRAEPGVPPAAPSPEPDKDPTTNGPVPDKGDPTTSGPVPSDDSVAPVNSGRRNGARPSPTPSPITDPPQTDAPPVAPGSPAIVPPPPYPADRTRQCVAGEADIMILRGSLPQPLHGDSVQLELLMLDRFGMPIKDNSCRGIEWKFEVVGFVANATITVSADTRYATIDGLAGPYVIRATTPNGVSTTVAITLQ